MSWRVWETIFLNFYYRLGFSWKKNLTRSGISAVQFWLKHFMPRLVKNSKVKFWEKLILKKYATSVIIHFRPPKPHHPSAYPYFSKLLKNEKKQKNILSLRYSFLVQTVLSSWFSSKTFLTLYRTRNLVSEGFYSDLWWSFLFEMAGGNCYLAKIDKKIF